MIFKLQNIRSLATVSSLVMVFGALSACDAPSSDAASNVGGSTLGISKDTHAPRAKNWKTDLLVFNGTMTATGDAAAVESIADKNGWTYREVTSEEMDALTPEQLTQFGTIVWPGGYAGSMSDSIQASTRQKLRDAVNNSGVGFVGFCAGAFIAVSPAAKSGEAGPAWGLSIVDAATLDYYHLEDEGTDDAMVDVVFPNDQHHQLVWWGGPKTPEYPGGVVARYADSKDPAISETWAGKGLMIISGPHPEAPQEWRDKLGLTDSDGLDQDIAAQMIASAMAGTPMPAMN